ncbi:MAG: NAD(P)-binding domain-containing protein [Bacteroidales bacterium]|jgi:glycerol-3-phosphate dehydrogenase (NAD(P)+)|nr:NAD(P)-binding domain-containing protein [Bacteroidales bacterium]
MEAFIKTSFQRVVVVGGGAIGTALANALAYNEKIETFLYSIEPEVVEEINTRRHNTKYFPGVRLLEGFVASTDMEVLKQADVVFMAVPSVVVVDFIRNNANLLPADATVVNLAKGFGPGGRTISEVLMEDFHFPVAAMKGPSFARELIQGSPTGFTIGCTYPGIWHAFDYLFDPTPVYVDFSKDVRGVELLSILKNIYAIAVGIMDAQFNTANLRFLFLTRAMAEMREVMLLFGGKKPTMFKYCGFGDFGLTSLNDLSRNRTLGLLIGKGFFNEQISEKVLLEGKIAVNVFCGHLQRKGRLSDFPILEGLNQIFDGSIDRGAFARKMLSK